MRNGQNVLPTQEKRTFTEHEEHEFVASHIHCSRYWKHLFIPPQNGVLGWYTVFSLSVILQFRGSVSGPFHQHLRFSSVT